MQVILDKLLHEPAAFMALLAGVLTAAVAAAAVLASGGVVIVAVLAGLSSLATSLGAGAVVRQQVSPIANESAVHPDVPQSESQPLV
jgi:hypothetical protein